MKYHLISATAMLFIGLVFGALMLTAIITGSGDYKYDAVMTMLSLNISLTLAAIGRLDGLSEDK